MSNVIGMSNVIQQLSDAIEARRDSLKTLRERLAVIVEEIPVGVILADDEGEVGRVRRVVTGASQWANREWDVTIKGKGLVDGGRLVCHTCEDSYFDGNNQHYHKSAPYHLDGCEGPEAGWMPGADTRRLALRLPGAVARYMAECEAERAANEAAALRLTEVL